MMTRLPFRANGHLFRIADGETVRVHEDDGGIPGYDGLPPFIPGLSRCATCDQEPELRITWDSVTPREPCPYPDGITTVTTLKVPSGKLIVSDDLRPAYDWQDRDLTASYNSALGQHQAILAMSAQGCAYGPVLNTSPGLYRTPEGLLIVATPGYGEDEKEGDELVPDGWELLAQVITDLWAYSIADHEDWLSLSPDLAARAARHRQDTVVAVTAGTWQFTHHTGERGFLYPYDTSEPVIFAEARLLEEEP